MEKLWGTETDKAIANFPISGERMPVEVIHMLALIKAHAAEVNVELGVLDANRAQRIAKAARGVLQGLYDEHFPIDVFQTGSGTSTNMNVNEVIATLAGGDVHPNDHVNLGQSSNDVVPTAVHMAVLLSLTQELLPALEVLSSRLAEKEVAFQDMVKPGRTHTMDAVPVTLGQEFGAYAAQVRLGADRVRSTFARVGQVPLGGTAVGTGLNTHPHFAARMRPRLSSELALALSAPAHPLEAQGARDGLVEASGALKTVAVSLTKIANDIRWMGSGPRAGLGEIALPELQKGSSIMPGKVNPVLCEVVVQVCAQVIGNDVAITLGGAGGAFELNAMVPLIARNLLSSIRLLATASRQFASGAIEGLRARPEHARMLAESTLVLVTALAPAVGYDEAAAIAKEAACCGTSLREVALSRGVDEAVVSRALDVLKTAYGTLAHPQAPEVSGVADADKT